MTEIRRISYAEILDSPEAAALLEEYSDECSIPEIGTPNPQRDLYAKMESSGLMESLGVFKEGRMIGFATILIFTLPHYGKKIANVESLFLSAVHRRGGAGKELMEHVESVAMGRQCAGVLYNARAGSSLERLLDSCSRYERTNSVFLRSLS